MRWPRRRASGCARCRCRSRDISIPTRTIQKPHRGSDDSSDREAGRVRAGLDRRRSARRSGRHADDDPHRRVGGVFRPGAGARQRDARRRAGLFPGGQRGRRRQRPAHRAALARRRLRARPRRGQHEEAHRRRRVPAVRLRRHADVQRVEADLHRGARAVRRAVHRRRVAAQSGQPLHLQRARELLRRDRQDRRTAGRRRRSTASPSSTRTTTTARPAWRASSAR